MNRLRTSLGALVALWLLCGPAVAETLEARLHWAQRVTLGTPVSGVIARVDAVPGQRVPAGQALLALDVRPLRARVVSLEAAVEGRRRDLAETERELGRTQELYDRTLLADRDLELARIAVDMARAELRRVEADLEQARWDLEYSRIVAPFEAWVLDRRAEPGQTVISNLQAEPLLVLARAGRMLARARVEAGRLPSLGIGLAVRVEVDGRRYPGRVQAIGLEPGEDGSYALDVEFDSGERLLRAGLPARIELP